MLWAGSPSELIVRIDLTASGDVSGRRARCDPSTIATVGPTGCDEEILGRLESSIRKLMRVTSRSRGAIHRMSALAISATQMVQARSCFVRASIDREPTLGNIVSGPVIAT